ncbi:NAD-dependent epimerase/dehydratase family protein, partial [bacterium]
MQKHVVFITGGTGYLGRALIPELLGRGHAVRALARAESQQRLPPQVKTVLGD